jgi:hypothetical protein
VTCTASLSPVVKYHGLARRYLTARGFLMRPLLNGGTLGGRGPGRSAGRRVKRQHKIVLGLGLGLVTIYVGLNLFGDARTEADASAQRFIGLLKAGDYTQARDTLLHMKQPPTVEFLERWWSECTQNADASTHVELTDWSLKSSVTSSNSSARLAYSVGGSGSTVPIFLTVDLRDGEWLVTDFSCPMTGPSLERMKRLTR